MPFARRPRRVTSTLSWRRRQRGWRNEDVSSTTEGLKRGRNSCTGTCMLEEKSRQSNRSADEPPVLRRPCVPCELTTAPGDGGVSGKDREASHSLRRAIEPGCRASQNSGSGSARVQSNCHTTLDQQRANATLQELRHGSQRGRRRRRGGSADRARNRTRKRQASPRTPSDRQSAPGQPRRRCVIGQDFTQRL